MKNLNPYINFNGKCREAMTFYRDCFGGELSVITVGESPVADQMPNTSPDSILHSALVGEAFTLMGTDMAQTKPSDDGRVSIVIDCASDEEISRLYGRLSEGGQVYCPLGPAFWGGTFGGAVDKFGISWMLNYVEGQ